jgi:alpha-tubulin suppressor-like RCC1 family protein
MGGSGGTPANGGQSGSGNAGTTSSGGMSGSAGSAGTAGSSGTSGTAGGGGQAGCLSALWGDYSIRSTDGAVMRQESSQQPPIINSVTALSLKNVTSVQHGAAHGCASTQSGEAWCWPTQAGGNNQGQLGDGTQTTGTALLAVRVKKDANTTLDNVTSVAAASTYNVLSSCAVSAGNVYCWGTTTDLLNNGTAQTSVYATQVTTNGSTPLSNVTRVALSYGHACAIVDASPDEVWCWGDNQYNEAGTAAGRVRYPTKINGIVDVKDIRVTAEATYALDGDRVKCWGRNAYNECGLTTNTSPVVTPTLVKILGGTPLEGITSIEGGSSEGCAIKSDQTLWCWGNSYLNHAAATPAGMPAAGVLYVSHGINVNPRYVTSDGKFHYNNGISVRDPYCGQLD